MYNYNSLVEKYENVYIKIISPGDERIKYNCWWYVYNYVLK